MPEFKKSFNKGYGNTNSKEKNFEQCLVYIKRTFPHDDPVLQIQRAEAVYSISEVFFNEILPNQVKKILQFSNN